MTYKGTAKERWIILLLHPAHAFELKHILCVIHRLRVICRELDLIRFMIDEPQLYLSGFI